MRGTVQVRALQIPFDNAFVWTTSVYAGIR